MTYAPPSPEEQVAFLRQLQRIFDEGVFTATYKYALLHAIADLCVTSADDSGAPLSLSTEQIAERFIELYWRQAAPFPAGERSPVLSQNRGLQAAVVTRIREAREKYGGSLGDLKRRDQEWEALMRGVEQTVRQMPLWKLQTVGSDRMDFLYDNVRSGEGITLKTGVAYCFRAFYSMILDMVEGSWSQFIRHQNTDVLGRSTDLRSFLFGTDRAPLGSYRGILKEVQAGLCLYCERELGGSIDVDHFIPWRRYPTDLGHNFVLAHRGCNFYKGDRLAAEKHLTRWVNRNEAHRNALNEWFGEVGVLHDWSASVRVARWAYGQVARAGGQVWVEGKVLETLSDEWKEVLGGTGFDG